MNGTVLPPSSSSSVRSAWPGLTPSATAICRATVSASRDSGKAMSSSATGAAEGGTEVVESGVDTRVLLGDGARKCAAVEYNKVVSPNGGVRLAVGRNIRDTGQGFPDWRTVREDQMRGALGGDGGGRCQSPDNQCTRR